MSQQCIGFIGMGIMGIPMAMHLSNAGYHMTVYDKNQSALEKALSRIQYATNAQTPADVAAASEIVITMLPDGNVVNEIALGEAGLIHGLKEGALLLDTSSAQPWITLETAKALAAKGIDMVDAPVSGAQTGAETGSLVFMVGGQKHSVARVKPLLQVMGERYFHLGPVGSGHTMKCINNLITAITFMATAEAMTIGTGLDLDPDAMVDVLNVSTGMSWISQTHIRQRILNRRFDDAFKLDLMVKDIGIAMGLADSYGIPLPLCGLGHHLWRAAAGHAEPDSSISEMVRWIEHMTGISLAGKAADQTP